MSSDNKKKKLGQLPPKAVLEAVKDRQPRIVAQVTISLMDNTQILVNRPECNTCKEFAGVIDLMATALIILAQKQSQSIQEGFAAEFINLASTIKRLAGKQAGMEEKRIFLAPANAIPPPPLAG